MVDSRRITDEVEPALREHFPRIGWGQVSIDRVSEQSIGSKSQGEVAGSD